MATVHTYTIGGKLIVVEITRTSDAAVTAVLTEALIHDDTGANADYSAQIVNKFERTYFTIEDALDCAWIAKSMLGRCLGIYVDQFTIL